MKLINKAIRELTEERVKKIKFSKGIDPKGVGSLTPKPKKSSGDTSKVGAASDTTKKGSWSADQDITTGEHYDELDKARKRMKKFDHSISGDYDDDAKDVVKIHEISDPFSMSPEAEQASLNYLDYDRGEVDPNALANLFQAGVDRSAPSSEVDRMQSEFREARRTNDRTRMRSLIDQLKAHSNMASGGGVTEGVSRILQLAGIKDVREMLVVTPKTDLDEDGEKKRKVKQEHGLIEEMYDDIVPKPAWDEDDGGSGRESVSADRYKKDSHKRFVEAVNEADLTPYHYRGRFYYEGPAVDVSHREMPKLYAALHDAGFSGDDLQQDNMGLDMVVYPR